MPITCPKCGAEAVEGTRFCEIDGAALGPVVASAETAPSPVAAETTGDGRCLTCGASADANENGWCSACGRRWRTAEPARDHKRVTISPTFGGVSDRGKRHPINEDDMALALVERAAGREPITILVVADGVSSSEDAHRASQVAAATVLALLVEGIGEDDLSSVLVAAIAHANVAVNALVPTTPTATADPPETTVVAAVVRDREVTIGWVGDSRAYWIADSPGADGPTRLLSHDHSWMNDMVESGQMSAAEAERDRRAHAITRCLGGSIDDLEGSAPSLLTFTLPPDCRGRLLLCTDGLWNYAPEAAALAALIAQSAQADATEVAGSLVAWANAQGGRDNITVVTARF